MSALKTSGYYLIPNWSDDLCIYQLSCFEAQLFQFLMAELYQLCKNPVIIKRNMLDMFLVEFLRKKIYGYIHDMK